MLAGNLDPHFGFAAVDCCCFQFDLDKPSAAA